jgi:hypothetical protein
VLFIKPTDESADIMAVCDVTPWLSFLAWSDSYNIKRRHVMGEKGSKKDKEKAQKQKQTQVEKKKEQQKNKLPAKKI